MVKKDFLSVLEMMGLFSMKMKNIIKSNNVYQFRIHFEAYLVI